MPEVAHFTEVGAVNIMLRSIGEPAVDSVTGLDEVDEAAEARQVLREQSFLIQSQGWNFNTREGATISKNANDEFRLPGNVISVKTSNPPRDRSTGTGQYHQGLRIAQKRAEADDGWLIYDKADDTEKWPNVAGPLTVNLVEYYDYNELPPYVQWYVTVKAAHMFQQGAFASQVVNSFTEQHVLDAMVIAMNSDEEEGDNNLFDHNPHMQNVAVRRNHLSPGRRRGYGR